MTDVIRLTEKYQRAFEYLQLSKIVDSAGIVIKPHERLPGDSPRQNTVYDWFDFGDDQRLHMLYTGMVDQIAKQGNVIHLESENWSADAIEHLADPGTIIFTQAYFSFKNVTATSENEHRRVRSSKNDVTVEFFVDTRNMFGDSSIYNSFVGRNTASALIIIKDVSRDESGHVLISASPLALGVGFQKSRPHIAPLDEAGLAL